jgi:hypothetical protein
MEKWESILKNNDKAAAQKIDIAIKAILHPQKPAGKLIDCRK